MSKQFVASILPLMYDWWVLIADEYVVRRLKLAVKSSQYAKLMNMKMVLYSTRKMLNVRKIRPRMQRLSKAFAGW